MAKRSTALPIASSATARFAEEVTQDTFLKVWHQTTRWDSEKGKLKNWLLTIAQFTAIDRLRKEGRQPTVHPEPIEDTDESLLTAQERSPPGRMAQSAAHAGHPASGAAGVR